jgi:hypothetical protein
MGFEGSSSWSLDILYGQSVSISRGLYIRGHNFQCSKFFSCRSKLLHTVTIDSSCLIQTSQRMGILIKKTLKLLSCSFRPYNTTLNLSSNLEHWKLWHRMCRPRLIDTDWPQSISRIQEEKPWNPIIWFLLFHSGHRSHRQYNYVQNC